MRKAKTIQAIAVDDEPRALELIQIHAQKISQLNIIKTFRDPLDAVNWLSDHSVDLIFLDINMPHLSGLSFRKVIGKEPLIIFTTAYSEYGAASYEQDAVDYVVKPILFERFLEAVRKVERRLGNLNAEEIPNSLTETNGSNIRPISRSIFVKSGNKSYRLQTDDILYLQKDGNYVVFFTPNKKVLSRLNMSQVKEILPDKQFIRVHKSFVINLHQIEVLETHQVTIGGKAIPIAKSYREELLEKLEKF